MSFSTNHKRSIDLFLLIYSLVEGIFIGTDTHSKSTNYIQFLNVRNGIQRISIQLHDGSIMKLRQNNSFIASKSTNSDIYIFSYDQFNNKKNSEPKPKLRLKGHNKAGKALEWNIINQNIILSGSRDSQLLIWDLNSVSDSSGIIHPFKKFKTAGEICGVSWNSKNNYLFATCGEKGHIGMYYLIT